MLLAGERYLEYVCGILQNKFWYIEVPMYGLTIGRQLSWLAERT
ncbi:MULTISPECIES: DUF6884 domain-containing protein [unclassified Bradyrhizobium]